MIAWRPLTNAVLSALLAPPCAACLDVLDRPLDGAVCDRCWSMITRTPYLVQGVSPFITLGCAIGMYEGLLREILHALKYDGRRSVASRLSRMMADDGREVLGGADAVVPVPLHWRRQRERGFNQAADLAAGLGIPILHALTRVRGTRPQVELPAAERHRNVHDAFRLTGNPHRRLLDGSCLVVIDDVMTTGATLNACARMLKRAGAAEVRALTAARVVT